MGKEDNLKPFDSNQSREEAKINGRKGGIASGVARRARKTMKEMLDYLLSKEVKNRKGEKATTLEAISVALINKAVKGDTKAFEVIRDTIGEKFKDSETNVIIQQPIEVSEKEIQKIINQTKELADEG